MNYHCYNCEAKGEPIERQNWIGRMDKAPKACPRCKVYTWNDPVRVPYKPKVRTSTVHIQEGQDLGVKVEESKSQGGFRPDLMHRNK